MALPLGDREANGRLDEAITELREAEAEGRSWEPTPAQAQAVIMAQRDFLLSGYDPGAETESEDILLLSRTGRT